MATAPGKARELRAGIGWLVVATLLGALAGAAWARQTPPRYEAVCVIDYGAEPLAAAGGAHPSGVANDEWYRTQDVVLRSHALAERVVQELRLDRDRSFVDRSVSRDPDAARSAAANKLQAQLEIAPVPETRAVRIVVEDTSPKRAARIAAAVADTYLKKTVDDRMAASERTLTWLSEQIGATSRQLAEMETEIQSHLEHQNGPAVALAERQAMLTEEIKRLTQARTEAHLSRIELSARLSKLKDAVQTDNPFDARAKEIDGSDDVKQLRAAYLTLLLDREPRAAEQTTEKAPVPLGQKKLDALWGRMQSTLDGIVRNAQAELAAVQQVETQLQGALERANNAGRALQRQELEHTRLSRERSQAEQWLKALRERSSATGVTAAAGVLNARVIDPATTPSAPLTPPILPGAALGALAGLGLSSLTLVLARRTLRARHAQDVQHGTAAHQIRE